MRSSGYVEQGGDSNRRRPRYSNESQFAQPELLSNTDIKHYLIDICRSGFPKPSKVGYEAAWAL